MPTFRFASFQFVAANTCVFVLESNFVFSYRLQTLSEEKKKGEAGIFYSFFPFFFLFFLLRWKRKKTHEVLKPGSWFVLFLSKCFTIFFHKVKLRQKLPTFQFARFQSVEANTCFFVLHFFWKAILSMQWNCVKS